jgi:hypothetical protein
MPADGHKALAAILVAIFEDVDRSPALAADTEAFDVGVPDSLPRSQLNDGFERNSTDRQLATIHLKLRSLRYHQISH